MGDLLSLYDRLTVFNGLSMNTVSHPDGTYFMSTGRHLAGGVAAGSSVDVVLAHEHGASQVFPAFSVGGYASSYLGSGLDQRAAPLRVGSIGDAARSLNRGASTVTAKDRDAVNLVLSDEAMDLANQSYNPRPMRGMALQLGSLRRLFDGSVGTLFDEASLASDPLFQLTDNAGEPTRPRFHASAKNAAAFAVRSFARNLGRCVAFACGGFDTHFSNYQDQAATQQEAFDIIALLVKALDATPHPTKTGAKLADHTHILVTSDFCRTPQININQGRDHYPNGSALVISPKFRGNQVFGRTNPDDLLPKAIKNFADGFRPVAPPDILATFLSAQGVVPRKHLRDGDVISEVLR
jgi:uncharacterized protein (DUF1501 family)